MGRVVLVLALLAVLAAPVAHAGDLPSVTVGHACGDLPDVDAPQDVRVLRVGCKAGRALAKAHWLSSGRFDRCALRKPSCTLRGYTCRRSFFGNSGTRVRCARGSARVRFIYGT